MRWVFFSSGLLKPPFLFSGFEAEIKFLWDSESKALESLAKPAEFQGIVKRIFLKWDGLWHNVSVFKLLFPKFMISRKMLNMEIINSIFSSPLAAYKVESASQQIYQVLKKIWMRLKIWKTCLVWINQYCQAPGPGPGQVQSSQVQSGPVRSSQVQSSSGPVRSWPGPGPGQNKRTWADTKIL